VNLPVGLNPGISCEELKKEEEENLIVIVIVIMVMSHT